MLNFVNSCPISYFTIAVERKRNESKIMLSSKISKAIAQFICKYQNLFYGFDKIIIYYDNGQAELSAILSTVFSIYFSNVEFRRAEPQKYQLLQATDFICTMELLKIKRQEKRLSRSEEQFFYKPNELKKAFLKALEKKKLL